MRRTMHAGKTGIALGLTLALLTASAAAGSEWTARKGAISASIHVGTQTRIEMYAINQRPGSTLRFTLRRGTCAKPLGIVATFTKAVSPDGTASFGATLTSTQRKQLIFPAVLTIGTQCLTFSQVQSASTTAPQPSATPSTTTQPSAQASSTPTATVTPTASPAPSASSTPTPSPTPSVLPVGDAAVDRTLPACPGSLAGLLTDAFIDPALLVGIVPLGNVGPPGHVAPVDHNYFATTTLDQIPVYAPANARVMSAISTEFKDAAGVYHFTSLGLALGLCRGIAVHLHGLRDASAALQSAMAAATPTCGFNEPRLGRLDDYGSRQCFYELNAPVTAGQQVGWTSAVSSEHGLALSFELLATNHNLVPDPTTNWNYYGHSANFQWAFCAFDMYSGPLKEAYLSKAGLYTDDPTRPEIPRFIARTVEPRCGMVNQNIMDSAQGTWFTGAADITYDFEAKGQALSLIHWNINPAMGLFATNGGVVPDPLASQFTPAHAGTIDREPSEIHADGKVYCINITNGSAADQGRILVQLLDNTHADFEHQAGTCSASSAFVNPLHYQR